MTTTLTYEQLLVAILGRVRDIEPAKRSKFAQDSYDACSFLQVCTRSKLKYHLGTRPDERLHAARQALQAIGVNTAADVLAPDLARAHPARRKDLDAQAGRIQDGIARSREAIFAELMRYAALGFMAGPDFFKRPQ